MTAKESELQHIRTVRRKRVPSYFYFIFPVRLSLTWISSSQFCILMGERWIPLALWIVPSLVFLISPNFSLDSCILWVCCQYGLLREGGMVLTYLPFPLLHSFFQVNGPVFRIYFCTVWYSQGKRSGDSHIWRATSYFWTKKNFCAFWLEALGVNK